MMRSVGWGLPYRANVRAWARGALTAEYAADFPRLRRLQDQALIETLEAVPAFKRPRLIEELTDPYRESRGALARIFDRRWSDAKNRLLTDMAPRELLRRADRRVIRKLVRDAGKRRFGTRGVVEDCDVVWKLDRGDVAVELRVLTVDGRYDLAASVDIRSSEGELMMQQVSLPRVLGIWPHGWSLARSTDADRFEAVEAAFDLTKDLLTARPWSADSTPLPPVLRREPASPAIEARASRTGGTEASAWLRRGALASNRFATTEAARVFVSELYALGATRVAIPDDSSGGGHADSLLVLLPKTKRQRTTLLTFLEREAERCGMELGEPVEPDTFLLWWD